LKQFDTTTQAGKAPKLGTRNWRFSFMGREDHDGLNSRTKRNE